ncbi:Methyltransferase-like protein 17, mitochondrial [Tyrophagus putrescentiae]|nr:Methyltransferase-like protein 17, mitochondrial [Tyrophagus putrescentiae]
MFASKATWSTTPWLLLVRSTRGHFFDVEKRASEPLYQHSRTLSSLIKNKFTFALKKDLPEEVLEATDGQLKPRRHPGARRRTVRTDELPIKLQLAATNILNKYRGKRFRADVERVRREFLDILVAQGPETAATSETSDTSSTSQPFRSSKFRKKEAEAAAADHLRRQFFIREPYSAYECAAYLAARLPANYAALSTVLQELQAEEPAFSPRTLFDFGSGPGTALWAADQLWPGQLTEVMAIDLNERMNELSRELLQRGTAHDEAVLDKVFYRQFLPVKHYPTYDLVVSAFSLLELPDTRSRLYVVENLWKKTSGALVIVEHGSKAGFAAVSRRQLDPLERERLLKVEQQKRRRNSTEDDESTDGGELSQRLARTEGSVVAPCPHDLICPRVSELLAKSFCNFSATYKVFDVGQENPNFKTEKFAYVILKRHHFENAGSSNQQLQEQHRWSESQKSWPRVVQPVVRRARHSICRVCTADGQLAEVILSKAKHQQALYQSGRALRWGDKLPVEVVEKPPPRVEKKNRWEEEVVVVEEEKDHQ